MKPFAIQKSKYNYAYFGMHFLASFPPAINHQKALSKIELTFPTACAILRSLTTEVFL